jgi:hypothetical protein
MTRISTTMIRNTVIAFVAILSLGFAACSSPITSLKGSVPFSGTTGALSISIGEPSSRTLLPSISMTPVSYDVSGTGPSGATFSQSSAAASVQIPNLIPGAWNVTANAKNASSQVIASGTVAATITAGTIGAVAITVSPLSGNGTLALSVTFPAASVTAPSIAASLIPQTGSSIPLTFTMGSGTASCTNAAIPNGYYTLSLRLLDSGILTMGAVEVVRIAQGVTTSGTYAFTQLNKATASISVSLTPVMNDPLTVTISGGSSSLTVGANMTVTAGVTGYTGNVVYVYYINGVAVGTGTTASPSYTFGSNLAVGAYRLDVSAFSADGSKGGSISFPFAVATTAAPVVTGYVGPPTASQVGPRVAMTSATGGNLAAGTYSGKSFTTMVTLASTSTFSFTDCEFLQGFDVQYSPGASTRTVKLDHCRSYSGIYYEDGAQKNWTITWCDLRGNTQALRPKGVTIYDNVTPTPFVVEDSILSISSLGTPAAHVEAMQSLGGNNMRFTRVRFITLGPYTDGVTGQTAAMNNTGGDTLFDECEFLTANAFYYTVYSNGANVLFHNCHIAPGLAGYLYPSSVTMATFQGCTDLVSGAAIN